MYYVILDKITGELLKYNNGRIVKCETIQDSLEYLFYVLDLEDIQHFEIIMKTI